jgi:hypothetical protein
VDNRGVEAREVSSSFLFFRKGTSLSDPESNIDVNMRLAGKRENLGAYLPHVSLCSSVHLVALLDQQFRDVKLMSPSLSGIYSLVFSSRYKNHQLPFSVGQSRPLWGEFRRMN